jgi:ribosomal protein L37E
MADCPNCGRPTLRTKDWVCQWCGYPLISKSYKVIDKTYKELQEERNPSATTTGSKPEPEFVPQFEPEPEPGTEPVVKPYTMRNPEPAAPPPQPIITPPPAPEPVRETPPAPPEVITPPPPPEPQAQIAPSSEPEPVMQIASASPVEPPPPSPAPENAPHPQSEAAPEPTPPPPAPREPVPSVMSPPHVPKPEMVIEPEPMPEPTIKFEDIQDGMTIAAEEIDALFRVAKAPANDAFTGKTIIITGTVEKVFVRDQLDIRYIMITDALKRMSWSLRCTFNKDESSKVARLQEGQEVSVQGKYEGYSKNIIFRDCILI